MKREEKRKKKTLRSSKRYPALDSKFMPRTRKEYLDIDYVDKLSPEEKDWLNRFMNETLNASFTNSKKDIIQDTKEKRKIYSENNARNRCTYSVAKATNRLVDIENPEELDYNIDETFEDRLVEYLDNKEDTED